MWMKREKIALCDYNPHSYHIQHTAFPPHHFVDILLFSFGWKKKSMESFNSRKQIMKIEILLLKCL